MTHGEQRAMIRRCLRGVVAALCLVCVHARWVSAEVRLDTRGSRLVFGNARIERVFQKDSWQTVAVRNVLTGSEYPFPEADDVVLEFAEISDIHQMPRHVERVPLRQFTYGGSTVEEAGGGKRLVFHGSREGVELAVSYELQPDWFYMKKRVRLTNNGPGRRFLLAIYVESLNNALAGKQMVDVMRGPMQYKPICRAADCFTLMEYPGGMEAMFDLKYFPGKFLAPGEQYTSYPAVIGMTAKDQLDFELRKYAFQELHWYPGVAPHNFAPWIIHFNWDGTPENIYPHLRKSSEMGVKLFVVDARLDCYRLKQDDREQWLEYELPERARFPEGLEGFLVQTRLAGQHIGYYLRTSQLVCRRASWMIDHPQLADRFKIDPPLEAGHWVGSSGGSCFAHQPYEEYFRRYTENLVKNYGADFFHFDWFTSFPCTQPNHNHLPNGWDAVDKQHEAFLRALTEMRRENPRIVLQSGGGCLSLHWMKWLSHSFIHDIWPGPVPDLSFTRSCGADSRERLHRYAKDGFGPMMLISDWTDAGGELTKNPFGWRDSFISSVALAPTLRVEAGLASYGRRDLAWMKKWLRWRSAHTQGYSNVRFLWGHPYTRGTEGYAFVDDSQGYLLLVNNEYADHEVSLCLDESVGIVDRQQPFRVRLLYPVEAVLSNHKASDFHYGDTLSLRLPFKTVRYLSVFASHEKPDGSVIEKLPVQADRWVVGTTRIASRTLENAVEHAAELSLAGKELPPKPEHLLRQTPADATITVRRELVDEEPGGRVYLLLYGAEGTAPGKLAADPFPGLRIWVNDIAVGGTVKPQLRPFPRQAKDLPFFYGDVTGAVASGINRIRWKLSRDAWKTTEVLLVREAEERFAMPAAAR